MSNSTIMFAQHQQAITVIDNMPTISDQAPSKKRRRRRQKKSTSSDASTSSEGSSSPSRQKIKKNKKGSSSPAETPLTAEEKSRYVALDCEMVGVGYSGSKSSLARVCIISWTGKKIYDRYVRQTETVTDYRTFVSGITETQLESEKALDFEDCREQVVQLLKGKVLVGHALKNDLHAMGITHPWFDTRDTGKYEPFMKVRFLDDGVLWPRKLKDLAKEKLGRDVQNSSKAHSPVEDAKTALDLYKLVRRKWEKVMDYKMNKTREMEKPLPQ